MPLSVTFGAPFLTFSFWYIDAQFSCVFEKNNLLKNEKNTDRLLADKS